MPFSLADLTIPVTIFLGAYGLFLSFYVLYGLFNLIHLMEYGRVGAPLFLIIIGFLGGTILLVSGSIFWLLHYDLTYSLPVSEMISLFKQYFLHSGGF